METRVGQIYIKFYDGKFTFRIPIMNAVAQVSWTPGSDPKIDKVETWEDINAQAEKATQLS